MNRLTTIAVLLLLSIPLGGTAWGQGTRKDDIVLNRFGQPVAGATVTVCTSGATGTPCSPLAAIFSDVALTQAKANPFTTDGQGNYNFYAAPARYKIQISGAGVTTTTIPDVLLAADPATPSYQSLNVSQGITAFSLNLGGNLGVTGSVSSSTSLSAPQTGSNVPVQIGSTWYPGTASGLVTPPTAVPAIGQQATGGSIAAGTYYCVSTSVNLNGETTQSPQQSVVVAGGTTNLIWLTPNDFGYVTGAYGLRGYCGTVSGGPYFVQVPYSRSLTIGNCNGTSNVATCDTSTVRHGLVDGDAITVAGNNALVNGGQVITAVVDPASGNSTISFAYVGGNFGPTAGGTISFYTGIPNQTNVCWVINLAEEGCTFSTIALAGANPPVINTATIDALQVAVNQTRIVAGASITTGEGAVRLSAQNYSQTTPLIAPYTKIYGPARDYTEQAGDIFSNILDSGWVNHPELGVVMVMGPYATIENATIKSVGSGSTAPVPLFDGYGSNSMNGLKLKGVFLWSSNNSSSAPCFLADHVVIAFGWEWKDSNTLCAANSPASLYFVRSTIALLDFYGGRINVNGGAAIKTRGGAMNKSLGVGFSGIKPGVDVVLRGGMASESGKGIFYDFLNGYLDMRDNSCVICDAQTAANTPAMVQYGIDTWGNGGSANQGIFIGTNTSLGGSANAAATIKFVGPVGGGNVVNYGLITGSAGAVGIDAGGGRPSIFSYSDTQGTNNISCDLSGTAIGNSAKIINYGPISGNGPVPVCIGSGDFFANGFITQNVFPGGVKFSNPGTSAARYFVWNQGGGSTWSWFSADPGVAANKFCDWGLNNGSAFTCYQNDGVTPLIQWSAFNAANQINLLNPPSLANNIVNMGTHFRFGYNGAGNYFATAGTPTGARLITPPDISFIMAGSNIAQLWSGNQTNVALVTPSIGGETVSASPRQPYNAFLPGALTSTWTGETFTIDKAITVTRFQAQAKTAPAGCTTNAVVRVTDGTSPVNLALAAAANDSGAITQNYAAGATIAISVQTAAAGCTTSPADVNVVVQYRMQ